MRIMHLQTCEHYHWFSGRLPALGEGISATHFWEEPRSKCWANKARGLSGGGRNADTKEQFERRKLDCNSLDALEHEKSCLSSCSTEENIQKCYTEGGKDHNCLLTNQVWSIACSQYKAPDWQLIPCPPGLPGPCTCPSDIAGSCWQRPPSPVPSIAWAGFS